MAKQSKPPDETERLFLDTIRRVLAIPSDEAAKIRDATAPAKPRKSMRLIRR